MPNICFRSDPAAREAPRRLIRSPGGFFPNVSEPPRRAFKCSRNSLRKAEIMDYFPFPAWFYIMTCAVALVIGIGIRVLLTRRERRKGEELKKERQELKKQQKRNRKQMKKAGRK